MVFKADSANGTMFLTLEECANELRVCPRTVRRMIQRRELVAVKLGDSRSAPIRILSKSLALYLQGQLIR